MPDVDPDVLVDFRGVDVDVNLLRVLRVRLQVAGDAVVEAHAERQQQIGLLDRLLTHASPCMPIMPRFSGCDAGKPPMPSSVGDDRDVGLFGERANDRPSRRRA